MCVTPANKHPWTQCSRSSLCISHVAHLQNTPPSESLEEVARDLEDIVLGARLLRVRVELIAHALRRRPVLPVVRPPRGLRTCMCTPHMTSHSGLRMHTPHITLWPATSRVRTFQPGMYRLICSRTPHRVAKPPRDIRIAQDSRGRFRGTACGGARGFRGIR